MSLIYSKGVEIKKDCLDFTKSITTKIIIKISSAVLPSQWLIPKHNSKRLFIGE
jgi:hypothetical protein